MKLSPAQILTQKQSAVAAQVEGRPSASSSSLSASFGLPVEDVRRILRSKGVRDDG